MEKYVAAIMGACLSLTACGEIKHTAGGDVDVNLKIDFDELQKYFEPVCQEELPEATESEIEDCVNLKIGEFLDAISG